MKYLFILTLLFMGCDDAPTEHTHPEPSGACTSIVTFLEGYGPEPQQGTTYGLFCEDGLTRDECDEFIVRKTFHHYYTCEEYCEENEFFYTYSCEEMDAIMETMPEESEEWLP